MDDYGCGRNYFWQRNENDRRFWVIYDGVFWFNCVQDDFGFLRPAE